MTHNIHTKTQTLPAETGVKTAKPNGENTQCQNRTNITLNLSQKTTTREKTKQKKTQTEGSYTSTINKAKCHNASTLISHKCINNTLGHTQHTGPFFPQCVVENSHPRGHHFVFKHVNQLDYDICRNGTRWLDHGEVTIYDSCRNAMAAAGMADGLLPCARALVCIWVLPKRTPLIGTQEHPII